jgi:hypothetical protein
MSFRRTLIATCHKEIVSTSSIGIDSLNNVLSRIKWNEQGFLGFASPGMHSPKSNAALRLGPSEDQIHTAVSMKKEHRRR